MVKKNGFESFAKALAEEETDMKEENHEYGWVFVHQLGPFILVRACESLSTDNDLYSLVPAPASPRVSLVPGEALRLQGKQQGTALTAKEIPYQSPRSNSHKALLIYYECEVADFQTAFFTSMQFIKNNRKEHVWCHSFKI